MRKIVAVIEKGTDGGYGIYAENESVPVVGDGMTEQEAREAFEKCRDEQAEYMKEKTGKYPDWHGCPIEYRYDMSAFFQSFPFINATEFARSVGINPSLMRKYKTGLAKASRKQMEAIQNRFDCIVENMRAVRF